jgi:hypothetical protein
MKKVLKCQGVAGHCFPCRNTLTYAHTNSRTLPASEMKQGSLTATMPEAGDFVESLKPDKATSIFIDMARVKQCRRRRQGRWVA